MSVDFDLGGLLGQQSLDMRTLLTLRMQKTGLPIEQYTNQSLQRQLRCSLTN
jgi:hypothetical protein